MFRLLLVFSAVQACLGESYPKCCGSDSVLKKVSSVYNCTEDLDHRIEIITNRSNFLADGAEGVCVDVEDKLTLFRTNGSDIYKEKELDVEFFPKCCPVDYFYNSTTHGCVKSAKKLEIFFGRKFVKVGLPHCHIIADLKLTTRHLDFTNGSLSLVRQNKKFDQGSYCIDRDSSNALVARICHDDYDICAKTKCIHKCCPDGQSFVNGSKCRNTYIRGLDLSTLSESLDNFDDDFAIIHGYERPIYQLDPNKFTFHISSDGVFRQIENEPNLDNLKVTKYYNAEEQVYCIEHGVRKTMNNYSVFRTFSKDQIYTKFYYTRIAMAISCVFLVLTIIYYCISNEKRTVFGKTLVSYCLASLLLFLQVSYLGFVGNRPNKRVCDIFAFFMFYLTLAIFTWMNVMCIDIYWTFGSSKSFSGRQHRSRELKRFMWYSLYGWGFPMVLTAITLIFYHNRVLPTSLEVIVDMRKCLIYKGDSNYATFLFSTTPLALLELCNLVLFIQTSIYCLKVKREISRMNDTQSSKGDKSQNLRKFRDRFGLLIKLFFIMGISFLFEVVSTFANFKRNYTMTVIEIIWDTFNSLQGLFIFVIFIVKKRILKKFGRRVRLAKLRKFSLVSSAITQTTSLPALTAKQ